MRLVYVLSIVSDMSNAAVAEVLAPYADAELIPLPSLARRIAERWNVDLAASRRSEMHEAGVLEWAPQRGYKGAALVTPQTAADLISAAILAAAFGVAVLTVLKGLQSLGVDPSDLGAVIDS